jgi:hypothetical protein
MVKNHEIIVEDLPVIPRVEGLIHGIRTAKYRSNLKGVPLEVARAVQKRQLTGAEAEVVFDELNARKQSLTAPNNVPPPQGPPEAVTSPAEEAWSPTAILDKIPTYELSPQDRAAGEAVRRPGE